MVSSTDRILPKSKPAVEDDGEAEEEADVKVMEEQSEFDHVILWGHEALPDEVADPYVRGMEEWIALAEQVCFPSFEGAQSDKSRSIQVPMKRTNRRIKWIGYWRFWMAWNGVHCTRGINLSISFDLGPLPWS